MELFLKHYTFPEKFCDISYRLGGITFFHRLSHPPRTAALDLPFPSVPPGSASDIFFFSFSFFFFFIIIIALGLMSRGDCYMGKKRRREERKRGLETYQSTKMTGLRKRKEEC
jgi:hypothetical protein